MTPLAFLGSLGGAELLVILFIVILLFGARRIPEIARGLGEGIRGFRTSLRGDENEGGPEKPETPNRGDS
jgi:sec-independent protein translocase protein TatA